MAAPARVMPAAPAALPPAEDKKVRLGALPRAAPLTDPNTPRKASWQPPSAAPAAALGPIGGDTPRRTASGAPSGPPSDSDIGIHTRVALTATPPVGATHPPSGGSSEAAPSSTRGASWAPSPALPKVVRQLTRRSTNAVQERYQNMAQERCNAAIERAAAIVRQRESNGLPPGVWWGFHYFWPPHAIEEKRGGAPGDPMEDPDFLKKVVKLMNDPTMVDTFCIFDADGSGSIDAKELEGLVQMLVPNPTPGLVKDMMRELDSNSDGEIDLWEFCVHMQKRTEGLTNADVEFEIDEAFTLFASDAEGRIGESEIKSVLMDPVKGTPLSDDEFNAFIDELARHGHDVRNGATIPLTGLRAHPCYRADDGPALLKNEPDAKEPDAPIN